MILLFSQAQVSSSFWDLAEEIGYWDNMDAWNGEACLSFSTENWEGLQILGQSGLCKENLSGINKTKQNEHPWMTFMDVTLKEVSKLFKDKY